MSEELQQQPNTDDEESAVTSQSSVIRDIPLLLHGAPKLAPKVTIAANAEAASSSEGEGDSSTGVIVPDQHWLGLESGEHDLAGKALRLVDPQTKQPVPASLYQLDLPNGVRLTYGDINWLAGDFYGTDKPISDNVPLEQAKQRFEEAFWTFAHRPESMQEIESIRNAMQEEIDGLNEALKKKEDPFKTVYKPGSLWSSFTDVQKWDKLTEQRESKQWDGPHGKIKFPKYSTLLTINYDHFGPDGRRAYEVGHAIAMETAAKGDLERAYCLNAFADHFLQDAFSSGHLRTPRRIFRDGKLGGLCANAMHNEDSTYGLSVVNPNGKAWTCYGDGRFYDKDDADNVVHLLAAQQISVDEVTEAWTAQKVPAVVNKAWLEAPTLASALNHDKQKLVALFRSDDGKALSMRKTIAKRYDKQWEVVSTTDASFGSLFAQIKASGAWEWASDTLSDAWQSLTGWLSPS